jgi:NifB/MoaA-like Fe-S oxidoreductase
MSNLRLGGTITAAGLLMGSDVLEQLLAAGVGDLVILPRVMFDHPDTITLDDLTPQDMANRLQVPVALADTMGDVWDALIGTSNVLFSPGTPSNGAIPLRVLTEEEQQNNTHLS